MPTFKVDLTQHIFKYGHDDATKVFNFAFADLLTILAKNLHKYSNLKAEKLNVLKAADFVYEAVSNQLYEPHFDFARLDDSLSKMHSIEQFIRFIYNYILKLEGMKTMKTRFVRKRETTEEEDTEIKHKVQKSDSKSRSLHKLLSKLSKDELSTLLNKLQED